MRKVPGKGRNLPQVPKEGALQHTVFRENHIRRFSRESGLDTAFLDAATSSSQEAAWFTDIKVGEQMVKFKLDTGAEVTAISHSTYQQLLNAPPLNTPEKVLCGPARKPLQVLGQCKIDLSHGGRSTKQQLFVVAELKSNLLGLPAIQDLNLAVRLDGTTADE